MYKYFLIALVAAAFVWLANPLERRLKGRAATVAMVACYCAAGLVFCVAAGVRATSVGTDVEMYVVEAFDVVQQSDLSYFWDQSKFAKWMPLSKLVFWIVPATTHSLACTLFAVHILIVAPVLVASRLVVKDRAFLAVLVFGVVFFPMSLNIMRQFIAMSFLLLSIVFVRDKNAVLFAIFVVIATLFHETALLGVLIYPLYVLGSGRFNGVKANPAVVSVVLLAAVQLSIPLLKAVAPYLGRFEHFITGYISKDGGGWQDLVFGFYVIAAILGAMYFLFNGKMKPKNPSPEASGLVCLTLSGIAIFSLSTLTYQLYRPGMYFLYFAVLAIPFVCSMLKERRQRWEFTATAVSLLAVFANYYYGCGYHEVLPYVISIGG